MNRIFSKFIVFSVASVMLLSGFANAVGAEEESPALPKDDLMTGIMAIKVDKSDAIISGQNKKIDSSNQEVVPFIEEERIFVPVRFISEQFGATVNWNEADKTIEITSGTTVIKLAIGKKVLAVNGEETEMDVAAMVKNERTFVPLRAIAEALGMNIYYDNGLVVLSAGDRTLDAANDKSLLEMLNARITNQREGGRGEFAKAGLMGEVTEVNGSAVTLKLIEMPQMNGGPGKKEMGAQNGEAQGTQPPTQDSGQTGQTGQAGGQNGEKTEPPQQRELTYTGETKTITIPEGISITTRIRNENKMEEKTMAVSELKAGDIVSISYSDNENEVISRVSVQSKN